MVWLFLRLTLCRNCCRNCVSVCIICVVSRLDLEMGTTTTISLD